MRDMMLIPDEGMKVKQQPKVIQTGAELKIEIDLTRSDEETSNQLLTDATLCRKALWMWNSVKPF